MPRNLANLLTMSRVAAIPIVIGLLSLDGAYGAWAALGVFIVAGITDWLDGYVARTLSGQSEFGRFLDPIADKLLVASTLMVLVAKGQIDGWAVGGALIILCREILVSGLREFLAGLRVGLPVSRLAKWKTAIQFVAIAVLMVGKSPILGLPIQTIGEVGLGCAAALTLVTGYDYLRAGLRHMDTATTEASAKSDAAPHPVEPVRRTVG